jgi:hypothetical protein
MIDVNYITIEDLQELTSISQNVDPVYLVPFIRSSEAMYVSPVLGTALDTELKQAITGNTLTGNNYTLVQFYIKPFAAWSTYLTSIAFLSFKGTNKGILRQQSDNSTIPTVEELNYLKQSIKDMQSFYKDHLIDYLEANVALYPNYRSENCNQGNSGNNNSNGIYLGNW